MNSRWSGIFMGATIGIALQIMLALLGTGVGLSLIPFERVDETWQWTGLGAASAIFLFLSYAVSYFIGGLIASRLHVPNQKGETCFQGLATWGVTSLGGLFIGLSFFAATATSLQKGVTGVAAVEAINQVKPKIVTDMSLLKGKAVSTITLGISAEKMLAMAKEKASSPEAMEVAEKARKATAASALFTFAMMLIGVLSSTFGAFTGEPSASTALSALKRSKLEERTA